MLFTQVRKAESAECIGFKVGVAASGRERQGLAVLNASSGGIILEGEHSAAIHRYFGAQARRLRTSEFFGFVEALLGFCEPLQMVVIHSLSEISPSLNLVGLKGRNHFWLQHLKRVLRESAIHQRSE